MGDTLPPRLDTIVIIGASAAVVSATVGIAVLVLNVLSRRPLLTFSFTGSREEEEEEEEEEEGVYVYVLSVRNDGERIVRDIQAQALLDGEPISGVYLLGSWTLAPDNGTWGAFRIPREALGDSPDPSRLSARVSRPRRSRRKRKDVPFGERSATLR